MMSTAIVIPACLEPLVREARWLVWRREPGRGGRLTKVPYRADLPSARASCNDPATWCSFDTAMRAYTEGGVDGIAFALLGSNIAAFDVDHCRDAASGALHEWAQRLVERCGSYVEITPSREGIRILGTGSDRKIHRKFEIADGASVEVYRNCARLITVTGNRISPALDRLADVDAIADQVVAELDAAKKAKPPNPVLHSIEPHGRDLAKLSRMDAARASAATKAVRCGWLSMHCSIWDVRATRSRRY
jgi:primase-polymerase (primpol)-like protein